MVMVDKNSVIIVERVRVLKDMHNMMIHMNNEDAYMDWIVLGMPDCPSEWDFVEVAQSNEQFEEITEWFSKVLSNYIEDGFYFA